MKKYFILFNIVVLFSFNTFADDHFKYATKKMIKKFNKKIEVNEDSFANEIKIIAPYQGCTVAKGLKGIGWCSVGQLWEYKGEYGNHGSVTKEFFRSYYNQEGLIEHQLYLILSYWDDNLRSYSYVRQEDGTKHELLEITFDVRYDANDILTYDEDLVMIIDKNWLEGVIENGGLYMKLYSDKSSDQPFWKITAEYAELYLDYINKFEKSKNYN